MRQRTTWTNRSAATSRRAEDIYDMNVEHPQPAITDYDTGDPSAWAEDVNSGKSVESEYQGGAVKRNEVGMPEMRDDTWSHRGTKPWGTGGGSYDNQRLAAAERKAMACERIARTMLRTNDEKLLEPTMMELMSLPSKSIVAMLKRMDKMSPASLPKEARFRRALACTKISALLLTEEAKEEAIERLATIFANLDDPTLRSILKIVATERVAMEEEGEEKEEEGETASAAPVAKEGEEEEEEEEEEKEDAKEDAKEEGVLEQADLDKLRDMMEEVEAAAEAGELAEPAEGGAPEVEGAGISFDEGPELPSEMPTMASDQDDLTGLFDNDESLAQREIMQAEQGFAPTASRTASTKGAKKLGAVQAPKGRTDDELGALWDRPE